MKKIFDISLPLSSTLPVWPDSPRFELTMVAHLGVSECNESRLSLGSHTGTHIDAPRHFVADGATVDQLPLDVLVGPVCVVEFKGSKEITAAMLADCRLPDGVERVLFKTDNSALWVSGDSGFFEDFTAVTIDGADWLATRRVKLVGIDYLSVQRYMGGSAVHLRLLGAGMVLLEGLCLAEVPAGWYELICLPLLVVGAEGAPARAILRSLA